jgi:hypothetical protein
MSFEHHSGINVSAGVDVFYPAEIFIAPCQTINFRLLKQLRLLLLNKLSDEVTFLAYNAQLIMLRRVAY